VSNLEKLRDYSYYSRFLKIVTKDSKMTSFNFNTYQAQLWEVMDRLVKENRPIRIIILKARQLGISTYCTGRSVHTTATNKNRRCLTIAQDKDASTNLFKMSTRFYDHLPDVIKPMKRFSNKKELIFENPDEHLRASNPGLMSSLEIETANNENAGRSKTITDLHISELAFWNNAGTVLTGLFQAVPNNPETSIVIESTANGMSGKGEEFYNRWEAAQSGESDFVPIFFPWQDNPEYEMDATNFIPDKSELDIMERVSGMTLRKLAWRRYKIKNEMGSALLDPVMQFQQEYPSTPEEAFISSGRTVFSRDKISELIAKAKSKNCGRFEI